MTHESRIYDFRNYGDHKDASGHHSAVHNHADHGKPDYCLSNLWPAYSSSCELSGIAHDSGLASCD